MFEGGDDLSSLRPGVPDWAVAYDPYNRDETVGNHKAHCEALNIAGAVPNRRYYYANSRDANEVLRLMNRGWQVIGSDDPERYGVKRLPEGVQDWSGGPRAFQDVVLMWIDQREYDGQQAERLSQYKDKLQGVVDHVLERGEQLAGQMRGNTGAPIYSVRSGHGIRKEDI
jgi:hypothetical protein